MKVNFCRGFLKQSSLVLGTLVILAITAINAHAGFNNWSSAGPVGKTHSVAVSTDGTTVFAGGSSSIYKNTVANGRWNLSATGPLVDRGIVFKPGDALTAYAAATDGIYKTTDGGVSWTLLSGAPAQAKSLAVDSAATADLYAATSSGLFRSTDGGGTWSPIGSGTPGSLPAGGVSAVAVTGATIYAGTTAGIWKSSTATIDWVDISAGAPVSTANITVLAVDPADPANIYAAAGSSFYASLDGGASWSQPAPFSTVDYSALAIDSVSTSPSTLYVGVIGTPTGLYMVSPANLSAWNSLSTSPPYSIAIAPNPAGLGFNNDLIFVGTDIGVLRNSDGFRTYNNGLTLPSIAAVVEAGGSYFAGGGQGIWSSADLSSWTLKSLFGTVLPPRIASLAPNPSLSADIFAGARQAGSFQSFQTIDSGVLWSPVTRDAGSGTEVVAIVRDALNSYLAVAGDGVYNFFNGSLWQLQANTGLTDKNLTGLSFYSDAGSNLWATSPGGIYLSTDGAANWALKKSGAYTSVAATATRVIAGRSGGVDISTDNGASWNPLNLGTSDVTSIGVHSSNPLVAVFGTAKDGAFLTSDGGATVLPLTSGLPALGTGFPAVNSVSFSTSQPSLVMLGLDGAGVYKRNVAPLLDAAPAALDFGTQLTGSNTILPITIKNSGLLPLNVSSILRTMTGGSPFAIGNGTCSTPPFVLNPGQSCAIDVTYSPVTSGASPADNVNIYSDAPGSLSIIPLTGQAVGSGPTKSWASPVSGDWSVATNWSPAGVPQSTDVVAINLPGTYTVTADTPATVAGLVVGAASGTQTLSIPATTLTLNGASSFGNMGALTLSGGTLDGTGQVDLYGTLNWNGTIKGSGAFNLQAVATGIIGTSPNTYLETRAFNNYGVISYSGTTANSIQFLTNATFNNYGTFVTQSFGSLIDVAASGSTFNNMAGAIFRKTTDNGTTNVDMTFNNSGTINTKTGTISLNKASSQSGICAIDSGTTLAMAGLSSHSINSGFSLVGAGTLSFTGGATIGLNVDLTNTVGAVAVNDATINGPGKLVNAAGKSLSLAKATINSALDNSGSIIANGSADSAINGTFTTFSGSTLTVDATSSHRTLTLATGFTNNGTIELNSSANQWNAYLSVTSGTLTNAAGANINALQGSGGIYYRYLNAALINQGTITASWPLFINKASAAHSNSGTINANENITVTQSGTTPVPSFTNTGTIAIAANKSFTVSGGAFNNNTGSTFSGTGLLAFTNSIITLNDFFTVGVSSLKLTNTTVNGFYNLMNLTGKTLTLDGASVDVPLYNDGLTVAEGTADSSINAGMVTSAGSTLRVDAITGHRTLTMGVGFTNYGTIELNSSANQWNATLAVTSGPLVNAASGIIKALQGSGGIYYRYLNAELNNQGTVTASWPLFINMASASHSNSGTINVNDNLTVTQSGTTPSFTNSGTIAIAATKTFTVSGGVFNNNTGSTFSGSGSLALTGAAAVTLNIDLTNTVGAISVNDATINGPGKLVNAAGKSLTLAKATINSALDNSGNILANGSADSAINGTLTTFSGSTLTVDATSSHRTLTMGSGFTNNGTIELNSSANQWNTILAVTSGSLVNAAGGVINALQGSGGIYYRYLNAELNNQGTITASWPLFINKLSAAHSNSGTINVNDNLTVTQSGTAPAPSFTNTGTVAIAATKTFTVSGGSYNNNTGSTFSGSGSLALTGAANVTLNVDLTNTVGDISVNDATFNGPGKLVNSAGKSLTLAKATINSALDNSGSIMVNGNADSTIGGALTTQSGSTLTVDATTGHRTLTIANGFTNNGTIELNSSSGQWNTFLAVTSGTLVNGSGANINTLMGSGGIYKRFLNAQLNNLGVITASYTTVIDKPSASHSNGGTINVNDNVTLTQTGTTPNFANTGVINIAATKSLTVNGGSFNHSSGTLQGTGTLDVSGSIFTSSGAIHPNIGGSAGTFTITGALATTATDSLNIDIGGTAAGTYDLLTVSDTASLNGSINVNLINSFIPALGDSFTILNCGTACSGTFATTNLPALTGAAWNLNYGANAAALTVNPTITATAGSFGSITPSGITSVNYGGNQGYTITPNTGYHITDVSVDGVSQGAINSFTFNNVTATHTIDALFAPDTAATAFTLTGSVNYSGSKSGRIYVTIFTPNGPMGTSMATPGSFSIQGVPAGVYPITAFMDVPGTGSRHESDPSGVSSPVTIATADVTGINITLTDPSPLTTVQPPTGLRVFPTDSAALAQWNQLDNGNGSQADSYSLYWDANPNPVPGSTTGSRLDIPATGDRNDLLLGGLANGTYYFVMTAKSGSVTSAPSTVYGPVTIGTPAGGYTVSGTVTFPAVANGKPLYLAIGDKNNTMYPAYIAAATSPQAYTVSGVPNGFYRVFGVIDVNNDGLLGIGDYKSNDLNAPVITVNNGALINADLTIGSENAGVRVMTQHWKASTIDMYGLNFELFDGLKRPVTARLNGGPNVTGPIDIGLNKGGGFYSMININTATPVINDSYTFDIGYSDGSSETITGKVTGVVNDFATPTTPTGSVSFNAAPTLSWTAPANLPANGSYYLQLHETGAAANPLFWDSNPLPLNQTSAVFNFDNNASQATLTNGKSYDWGVMVSDQQGNFSTSYTSFSFPGEVSLTPSLYDFGTVPVGGGATWPLTISNNSSSPVSVYGITVSGADFTLDYTGGSNPCNSQYPFIAAGGNCTFNILINPATAGLKSATVTVTTNNVLTPSLTANFSATAANFTITAQVSAGIGGYISPPGTTSLASGGNVAYFITSNPGYHVVDVKVDGVSQGAITSYTFSNVTANHTISAIFAINSSDISGTINYSGSKTGRVYITLQPTGPTQPSNGILGTSIAAPGAFTIRGVPDGSYSVNAFMDSLDLGSQVQVSPNGATSAAVAGANLTGLSITLTEPTPAAPAAPVNLTASPGDGSLLMDWDKQRNNGIEPADAYDIYWGTSAGVSKVSNSGSRLNVPAGFDSPLVLDGLNNGDKLYVIVIAKSGGVESVPSAAIGPFTIGAPTGGYTVSGTLNYSGPTATGPLYIAIVNPMTKGAAGIYFTTIAAPSASNNFTVTGVPNGEYVIYSIIDMNNDRLFGTGDVMTPDNQAPAIKVNGTALTGVTVSLTGTNGDAAITTDHNIPASGPGEYFNVEGSVRGQLKRPVAVTLTAAPATIGIPLPLDLGLDGKDGSGTFRFWTGSSTRPTLGDTYTFTVTYADGTVDTNATAAVTGVSDNFPTNPQITAPITTVPTFSWVAPATPPASYSVWVGAVNSTDVWDAWDLPSSINSITYGATGSSAQPLLIGSSYYWHVSTKDPKGNRASIGSNFVPANQGTPLIFWPAPAAISLGTALSAAELNATASVPGTFSYSPANGTVLPAGAQTLTASFTPTDTTNFTSTTATVTLNVNPIVTATASSGGSITPAGVTMVTNGGNQPYSIVPTTGYHIVDVKVDGVSQGAIPSYTFSTVTANHTIDANFAIDTYALTTSVSTGSGTISVSPLSAGYSNGSIVLLTANPDPQWVFTAWGGDCTGTANPYSLVMNAAKNCSASFSATTFNVTATAGSGGSITPAGVTSVAYNGSQSYVISANAGYHILDVKIDGVSHGAISSYAFTNTVANHTIDVSFAVNVYTITASASAGGSISPSGSVTLPFDASQTYVITPDSGYFIDNVKVDNVSIGMVSSYTFTNLNADHTITVDFSRPNGVLDPTNTSGVPKIGDAMIALAILMGDIVPTPYQMAHADVAPLLNGVPQPDGKIDIGDVLWTLRKVVGLAF